MSIQNIVHDNIITPPNESVHQLFTQLLENGNKILQAFLEQKNYKAVSDIAFALDDIKGVIITESTKNRTGGTNVIKDVKSKQDQAYADEWLKALDRELKQLKPKRPRKKPPLKKRAK